MFFITCPTHDSTLHYISSWSKEIIDLAKKKGKRVIVLDKKNVIKKNVEKILKKRPIRFVMFNGHGEEDLVSGYKNQPLIKKSCNEKLLKSKIIYCRSCRSAKLLGPCSVISGSTAFIGYDDDFVFISDSNKESTPLQDDIAAKFLKPSNTVAIALLKGNTVERSYQRAKERFRKEIHDLLTSETSADDIHLIPGLLWDMQHLTYDGDGTAIY